MAEEKKTRTVTKASDVKPAEKPAARKVSTATGEKTVTQAKPVGDAKGKRIAAIILWVCAFACEILGILMLVGKVTITFAPTLTIIIGLLVLDLILVIIGSQLWKKANHIDPASKKNKVKFFLWNNMGVIVCIICFLPYIILLLKDKNLDAKTRKIAIIAAVAALLIGGACSVDYNPVSEEEKDAAIEAVNEKLGEDSTVFWTTFGKVYHFDMDCQHINQSDLVEGSVEEGIAAGKTRLCKTCAHKYGVEDADIALED